jgi:hypothetical protein
MFALAITSVFNGTVATCVRDSDLLRLLTKYDKIPGLPSMAISMANFFIIATVTTAYYQCYHFTNDAFIYMSINLCFAFTSLFFNHAMRVHAHVTNIPISELQPLFDQVCVCVCACACAQRVPGERMVCEC